MADYGSIELKMARAKHHLADLKSEMETVYLAADIRLSHSTSDGERVHHYTIEGLPQIPREWSSIIGDCLHNARSSLDHLSHEIVRSLGGTPVTGPGGTSFPIVATGTRALTLKGLNPIPSMALTLLDSVQPRNNSSGFVGEFIGAMSELDNRDKHTTLLLVQHAVNWSEVAWGGMADTPAPVVKVVEDDFANGDEVVTLTYPTSVSSFDPSPRLPIRPLLEPDLDLWTRRERMTVDKFLGQIITSTGRVIEKFRTILP
jgi:hypothetical protein